nr:hypothetical protein [Tanacetum cinerariifolium]
MKDNARILEFALRRKGVGIDANDEPHILDYALSRKIAKKNRVLLSVKIIICKTKPDNGFSLIQKLLPMGRPSCEKGQEIIKEADIIDGTLRSLLKNVKKNEGKTVDLQMVIERLQNLDCRIQGYEVGLDSLFRKMIQTRVSLLNILAN